MRYKMVGEPYIFTYAGTESGSTLTVSVPSANNGWVKLIAVKTPNFTNAPTAIIKINDVPNGLTPFTSAACANNATTSIGDALTAAELGSVPLGEYPWTISCTLSGTPGSAGNVLVVCYFSM